MTNQSAQPITEKELAEKLERISASMLGLDKKEAWTRVAREAAELMGYEFTPEKPEPGTWHVVAEGDLDYSGQKAYVNAYGGLLIFTEHGDYDNLAAGMVWPDLTPARVAPAAELEAVRAAQDTLEELAKMGVAESDRGSVLEMAARLAVHGIDSDEVDRMVKQHYSTAQHAAPAEDMPDWDDVRNAVASQRGNGWSLNDAAINGITDAVMRLLHREEA